MIACVVAWSGRSICTRPHSWLEMPLPNLPCRSFWVYVLILMQPEIASHRTAREWDPIGDELAMAFKIRRGKCKRVNVTRTYYRESSLRRVRTIETRKSRFEYILLKHFVEDLGAMAQPWIGFFALIALALYKQSHSSNCVRVNSTLDHFKRRPSDRARCGGWPANILCLTL